MQAPTPTTPVAPPPPAVPQPEVVTLPGGHAATPADVYQAFRAQRRELARQLDELEDSRDELARQLQEPLVAGADKRGVEQRIAAVDQRISAIDEQMAAADAAVARAASVPGAAVEPPPPERSGPPEEVVALGMLFTLCAILPLSIAHARRIWRRSAMGPVLPADLGDRLTGLEQSLDSVAIEVERIGEGQRFMTRVFAEGGDPRALGAAADAVERAHGQAPQLRR